MPHQTAHSSACLPPYRSLPTKMASDINQSSDVIPETVKQLTNLLAKSHTREERLEGAVANLTEKLDQEKGKVFCLTEKCAASEEKALSLSQELAQEKATSSETTRKLDDANRLLLQKEAELEQSQLKTSESLGREAVLETEKMRLAEEIKKWRENHGIQIVVKDLKDRSTHLTVLRSETIADVKKIVSQKTGISRLELIFAGRQLEDDNELADYNVVTGSILHLVNRSHSSEA